MEVLSPEARRFQTLVFAPQAEQGAHAAAFLAEGATGRAFLQHWLDGAEERDPDETRVGLVHCALLLAARPDSESVASLIQTLQLTVELDAGEMVDVVTRLLRPCGEPAFAPLRAVYRDARREHPERTLALEAALGVAVDAPAVRRQLAADAVAFLGEDDLDLRLIGEEILGDLVLLGGTEVVLEALGATTLEEAAVRLPGLDRIEAEAALDLRDAHFGPPLAYYDEGEWRARRDVWGDEDDEDEDEAAEEDDEEPDPHDREWLPGEPPPLVEVEAPGELTDEALLALLPRGDVLSQGVVAEVRVRSERLLPALEAIVRDPGAWTARGHRPWQARHAALFLAQRGGPAAAPAVLEALRQAAAHEDPYVLEEAGGLFRNISPADCAQVLRGWLNDPSQSETLRLAAFEALAGLAVDDEEERAAFLGDVRRYRGRSARCASWLGVSSELVLAGLFAEGHADEVATLLGAESARDALQRLPWLSLLQGEALYGLQAQDPIEFHDEDRRVDRWSAEDDAGEFPEDWEGDDEFDDDEGDDEFDDDE